METGRIIRIAARDISPNRAQPRRAFDSASLDMLADSIRLNGILQPLTVRPTPASPMPYELIAGERRLRAAILAGMDDVPCIVIEADDRKSAELALIENLHRENLNIFEQAGALAALIDIYSITQEQAAHQLSVTQSCVANKLRLLRLTETERDIIISASLTERHARAVLRIRDVPAREAALRYIADRELNVAAAENYVDRLLTAEAEEKRRRNSRIIIKDVRLFYNTIDHAVDVMRQAGLDVAMARQENGGDVEMTIRIKNVSRETA